MAPAPELAPRALITRALEDAGSLTAALRARGFQVCLAPSVARCGHPEAWRRALARADEDRDLLLTSAYTARLVADGPPLPSHLRVVAVGPRTAAAAEAGGIHVHLVPPRATGADAVAAMGDLRGRGVLYPRPHRVTAATLDALRAAGAVVHDVVIYENIEPADFHETLRRALPVDLMTVLSGSAARRTSAALERLGTPAPPVVAIGPTTAADARDAGLDVVAVAEVHTAEGVADAAAAWWSARR